MDWFEKIIRAFDAATISMGSDGSLWIISSRERILAWGLIFCLVAATSLFLWLLKMRRRAAISVFLLSLLIPLLIMPSLKHDRIQVKANVVTIYSGPWFLPSTATIDLSSMGHIAQLAPQYTLAGYTFSPWASWHLRNTDGSYEEIRLNRFFTSHRMVVAQYLRDRGRIVRRPQ